MPWLPGERAELGIPPPKIRSQPSRSVSSRAIGHLIERVSVLVHPSTCRYGAILLASPQCARLDYSGHQLRAYSSTRHRHRYASSSVRIIIGTHRHRAVLLSTYPYMQVARWTNPTERWRCGCRWRFHPERHSATGNAVITECELCQGTSNRCTLQWYWYEAPSTSLNA